jgi:hypothetical protein
MQGEVQVTITDDDLSRWEALCAAATPHSPPLRSLRVVQYSKEDEDFAPNDYRVLGDFVEPGIYGSVSVADMMTREDAEFFVAARTAVPDLCAGYREKASMVAALEDSVIVYEQGWAKAEAERDAAREALDTLMQANLAMAAERDALRAENERLRAAINGPLVDLYLKAGKERDTLRVEVASMQAERAAIQRAAYDATAEVRELRASLDAARTVSEDLARANLAIARDRDALQVDVESFQCAALLGEDGYGVTPDMVEAHVTQLRASLADAVGKIEMMRAVYDAAREVAFVRRDHGMSRATFMFDSFLDIVDAYEEAVKP